MRTAWKIYENKTILEEESKLKPGIFLIPHERFKILEFSILPSIDEEDRKRSVQKKLEERFIEIQELPFLYYERMQSTLECEKILCCYLKEALQEEEFPPNIECAIPSFLLGKILFEKKEGALLDYGRKEIFLGIYKSGKMESFQQINRLDLKELPRILGNMETLLLLGDYTEEEFLYWSKNMSLLPLESVKKAKLKKEMDIFQEKRLKGWKTKSFSRIFSKLLFLLLLGNIILGFSYQYQMEKAKEILGQVEEENKILEVDSRKLEEKMLQLREEEEEIEGEKSRTIPKIVPSLKKIYALSSRFEIISLEYLETESFKLQFCSFSTREYLNFLKQLILSDFQFINHDYIEKQEEQYKFEIEIIKKEEV